MTREDVEWMLVFLRRTVARGQEEEVLVRLVARLEAMLGSVAA